jgi:hypothetical protein
VNKYWSIHYILYSVFRGGGGIGVMWRAYTGVIHCVFDQIPTVRRLENWSV